MPEGTLQVQIAGLEEALAAVRALLGEGGGGGLAGAASLVAESPAGGVPLLGGRLEGTLSGALRLDPGGVTAVPQVFARLEATLRFEPGEAFGGFSTALDAAGALVAGDLAGELDRVLATLDAVAQGVPRNPFDALAPLVDRLLAVLAGLGGPEAAAIEAWVRSVAGQLREVLPLVEEAQAGGDPGAVAVRVVGRAIDGVIDTLGLEPLRRLVALLDGFPGDLVAADGVAAVGAGFDATAPAFAGVRGALAADLPAFRSQVEAAAGVLVSLQETLRPVLSALRRVARAGILRPGALEAELRRRLEAALGVEVVEAQRIEDPFQGLFDRLDAAIDEIDLSAVRDEVLAFFAGLRATIEGADLGSLTAPLAEPLAAADAAVRDLETSAAELVGRVQALFADLLARLRELAGTIGAFRPDGTFELAVEGDLRAALDRARAAVLGDPADPAGTSLAGTVDELRRTVGGLLERLDALLAPLESAAGEAIDGAVAGIEGFAGFLGDLDLPGLLVQLRERVEAIVDGLGPIDFAVVVDPVVEALDENAGKLAAIDPSSLNDLLREALAAALGVVIQIDFSAEVSAPLGEQMAAVKRVPEAALDELQRRYEEAVARLDALGPEQLVAALAAAFEVIDRAVAGLAPAALVAPLDALYERLLVRPLGELRPGTLLAPLSAPFAGVRGALDGVRGEAVVAPLATALGELQGAVAELDLGGRLDALLAAVERLKADAAALRPSALVAPLADDLARLEAEIDRFRPSVLFAPVAELAAPLLELVENVQQETATALFELFREPLAALDRLRPQELAARLRDGLDALLALLDGLDVPGRFTRLKGAFFDLQGEVRTAGGEARLSLALTLDPQLRLGRQVAAYQELVADLRRARAGLDALAAAPGLADLYDALRERLLALLPPYARAALDPETFRRVMRLADPTRFLAELDERFAAVKARLVPIRPEEIGGELDATFEELLAVVEGLDLEAPVEALRTTVGRLESAVAGLRVDFLAADVDRAVADLRAVVDTLDPARAAAALDALHADLLTVVAGARPSALLAGLEAPYERIRRILARVDPRVTLEPPLDAAWQAVLDALAGFDVRVVLAPLVDRLDELEAELVASLRRAESSFDGMLSAARGALAGGGGASASVSVSVGAGGAL